MRVPQGSPLCCGEVDSLSCLAPRGRGEVDSPHADALALERRVSRCALLAGRPTAGRPTARAHRPTANADPYDVVTVLLQTATDSW